MFQEGCDQVVDFVRQMEEEGLDRDEMVKRYYDRYWNPKFIKEQPIEAYLINARAIIGSALRATYR
ncbi:MAG: hypothetical protein IJV66_06690 [Firmicutes bacterium]|nr:hypothetical protein [Bacillota bacterium]